MTTIPAVVELRRAKIRELWSMGLSPIEMYESLNTYMVECKHHPVSRATFFHDLKVIRLEIEQMEE